MYEVDKYTVSLLHFDDGIKDETRKVWTAVGSPAASSTQSKFGGRSLYLDGSSYLYHDVINSEFDLCSGDFTIEWWEYLTNINQYNPILNAGKVLDDGVPYYLAGDPTYKSSNVSLVVLANDGTNQLGASNFNAGVLQANVWVHRAITKKGDTYYGFANGILQSTCTITDNHKPFSNGRLYIGYEKATTGIDLYINGYIDEMRISNVARWTEDFDPEHVVTNNLLRVTMLDSSERDYQLSTTEIDGFVNWFNSHTSTDTTSYMLNKKVGTQNSKEYLSFDKIISFEVIKL